MRRAVAYVLSLVVFASATWMPTSVFAQTTPGNLFAGGGGGAGGFVAGSSIEIGAGTAAAPSLRTTGSAANTGLYAFTPDWFTYSVNGTARASFSSQPAPNPTIVLDSVSCFGWAGGAINATADVIMCRGGTTGALRLFGGTTPTQSGTTCGTAPTIAGNNSLGSVTLGAAPGLPCTIVFNGTWTNAPKCFLNAEVLTTASTTVRATGITTTQFVITSTAALVATDKVSWHCLSS